MADERFFGGAKGVGKSLVCLADFAYREQLYGGAARGLMLRRTFGEFTWLLDTAAKIYRGIAHWDAEKKAYIWPSGASLFFGFLEHDRHLSRYQGQPYTHLYFDELPEWPSPYQYLFMHSMMRTTDSKIHPQILGTGNPGRPGQGWVHQRFVAPMDPLELFTDRWTKFTRQFIPARLEDNPHVDIEQYDKALRSSAGNNRQLYLAFRYGDWSVWVGQAFPQWDPRIHVVRRFSPPIEWPRFASLDWGTRKPYAILYFAVSPDGQVFLYHEDYGCEPGTYDTGVNASGTDVAKQAGEYAFGQGLNTMVIDKSIKDVLGHGFTVADMFQEEGWSLIDADKSRVPGKNAVDALLDTFIGPDQSMPMFQVMDCCRHFIRTFPTLVYNDRNEGQFEDVDTRGEDHLYDALRYFAMRHDMMPGSPRILQRRGTATTRPPRSISARPYIDSMRKTEGSMYQNGSLLRNVADTAVETVYRNTPVADDQHHRKAVAGAEFQSGELPGHRGMYAE